jgi:hypothetical protein
LWGFVLFITAKLDPLINRQTPQGEARGVAEMLVESAYAALDRPFSLFQIAAWFSKISVIIKFLMPVYFYSHSSLSFYSQVYYGGEFQIFPLPPAPPPAGLGTNSGPSLTLGRF